MLISIQINLIISLVKFDIYKSILKETVLTKLCIKLIIILFQHAKIY